MSLPSSGPASMAALWAAWLGYRIPHWDALERAAATSLTGSQSARVRVGWDAATGTSADWHATLFTLAAETPDPEKTEGAAREYKPAGFILRHVITDEPHPEAVTPPDPRPKDLAALVREAFATQGALAMVEADSRASAVVVDRARRRTGASVDRARTGVEAAISDGLRAREGFLLVPPMIVKPEMAHDWLRYHVVLALRRALAGSPGDPTPWRPGGIAVCRACTAVFVPRRRQTAEFCDLCSKRPAEPFVVGERPLAPGTRQTVRVPQLAGRVIVGWTTTTIGLCPDCAAPFTGGRDAAVCPECSNRARQRRHRRSRGTGRELTPLDLRTCWTGSIAECSPASTAGAVRARGAGE